jgi:protein O-GlcNAc transferase
MSSSILSAAGLPEMVTHSLDNYENLGVRLAGETDELNAIRQRLVRNRLSVPLFDTALFVRHLEIAFEKMWAVYRSGDTPRPIRAGEILGQAT